jgi:hypothetical protein
MTFVDVLILIFGFFVTAAAAAGAILIGLSEAADTDHARTEDLLDIERQLVDRDAKRRDG